MRSICLVSPMQALWPTRGSLGEQNTILPFPLGVSVPAAKRVYD